jgi:hypothetical protein
VPVGGLVSEQMAFLLIIFRLKSIWRRKNRHETSPELETRYSSKESLAENGEVGNDTISPAAPSKDTSSRDEDRRVIIRFTIATALAFGLPAAIGFGLYFVAHAVLG